MKIAICCATPYQTLNALNLVYHFLNHEDKVDLYYRKYDSISNDILNKIEKYNLFTNIYKYNLKSKQNFFSYILNDLLQAMAPSLFISSIVYEKWSIKNKDYDYVSITSGTELEVALTRVFPKANTIAYDDGLGSYIGDILHDQKLHIIWRVLGRNTKKISPKILYVNNKNFCESKLTNDIRSLKNINDVSIEYKKMILDIFNFDEAMCNKYLKKKIIYLTQPMEELEYRFKNSIKEIEKILNLYKTKGIIRKHPRDKTKSESAFVLDTSETLWELICNSLITNDHILISVCSTTQIIPKILFNKEPWLIFTYKIYDIKNKTILLERFEPIIRKIQNNYIKKEKILIPETIEDFKYMLEKIC